MNKFPIVAILIAITLITLTTDIQAQKKKKGKGATQIELKNEMDSVSYSLGLNIGESIGQMGPESAKLNLDVVAAAMADQLNKGDLKISMQDARAFLEQWFAAQKDAKTKENMAEGKAFLEQNKNKEGVKTTDSGLQYEVLQEGSDQKPAATNEVTVHYEGKLIDGTIFDSSIARGEPATFPLNQVIKGWTEGLQLMGVGAKYRFYIPSELGYGARGAGAKIGPNAVLIFDVELLSIN
jgi:FKBP-type peptidyl-prolyl cis-trans isomerase